MYFRILRSYDSEQILYEQLEVVLIVPLFLLLLLLHLLGSFGALSFFPLVLLQLTLDVEGVVIDYEAVIFFLLFLLLLLLLFRVVLLSDNLGFPFQPFAAITDILAPSSK